MSDSAPPYFWLLFAIPFAWVVVMAIGSAIARHQQGKPILSSTIPNADFCETSASGASSGTWLTRSRANRCLVVAVANGRFTVGLQFPFNLFVSRAPFLDHDVSVSAITSVALVPGRRGAVRVVYSKEFGEEDMTLELRSAAAFIGALKRSPGFRGTLE